MLIDRFLTYLAPHHCLGCSAEGALLCSSCAQNLPLAVSRCFVCQQPTNDSVTCSDCAQHTALTAVQAATRYDGLAKELVRQLKFHSTKSAAAEMATCIAERCRFTESAILIPVPTATSRVRARSYDQAELLAQSLSRLTHMPYAPVLRRLGQAHQVGAGRQERLRQLENAYRLTRPQSVAGKQVILIDDVATTGATVRAAARLVHQAGATRVSAAVFAQA